jgi:hypothetical protein
MAQRTHTGDQHSATESKFYIPAGAGPSLITDRVERVWASLFEHQVGPRR